MINSTHTYICTHIIYNYLKSDLATAPWRVKYIMINSTHMYIYHIHFYKFILLATARWRVTENAAFSRQRLNRELTGDQELRLSSVFTGISAFTSFARIISFWLVIVDLFGIMSLSLHRYSCY